MTAGRVIALWAALSVTIALVVAMAIHSTTERDLPEQVDRYLRHLGGSRRTRTLRHAMRITTVTALIGMVTVASFPLVHDVPGRIIVAALGDREADPPVADLDDVAAAPRRTAGASSPSGRLPASPDDEAAMAAIAETDTSNEAAAAAEEASEPDAPAGESSADEVSARDGDEGPSIGDDPEPTNLAPVEFPPDGTTTTTTTTPTTTTTGTTTTTSTTSTTTTTTTSTTTTTTAPPDETTTTTTTAPPEETTTTTTTAPPDETTTTTTTEP